MKLRMRRHESVKRDPQSSSSRGKILSDTRSLRTVRDRGGRLVAGFNGIRFITDTRAGMPGVYLKLVKPATYQKHFFTAGELPFKQSRRLLDFVGTVYATEFEARTASQEGVTEVLRLSMNKWLGAERDGAWLVEHDANTPNCKLVVRGGEAYLVQLRSIRIGEALRFNYGGKGKFGGLTSVPPKTAPKRPRGRPARKTTARDLGGKFTSGGV